MANRKGQPPKKPYELRARDLFARKLEVARRDAGHESKAAGARALGMEAGTYERWERAEAEPNIYWLGRISHVFRIPLDSLIPAYKDPAQAPIAAKAKGAGRANRPFRAASG